MKKAGCWLISYGIESASQITLNLSKKKYDKNQAKKTIAITNKSGILSIGHFILGMPNETRQDIINTIDYSNNIGLDFALFYNATPFPGSELYEQINKSNKKSNIWNKIIYSKNTISKIKNINQYYNLAYHKFYLNPNRVKSIYKLIKKMGIKNTINIIKSGLNAVKLILFNIHN